MLLRAALAPLVVLLALAAWAGGPAAQSSAPSTVRSDLRPETGPERGGGEAGHGTVTVQLGFYDHDDSGDGNPFLDEDLTVVEPVVIFDYDATDRLSWGGTVSFDYVSSASIDRLSNFPDQSGASGDTYLGADLNLRYATSDQWTIGGHAGFSTEYDYDSVGLGLSAAQSPRGADATITYSLDAYLDDVEIIRFDGTQDEGSDSRTSLSATVVWYQVLSPRSHAELGLTLAKQTGFLETPYNAVVVEDPLLPPNPNLDNMARGTEITEELPDDRFRTALFGRYRRAVGDADAWELGGRIYDDDWGITSFTVEPRYYHALVPDELDLRLRYRYYTQTEADYFQDHFTTVEEFRTQDSDLGDYDTHTFGVKLTWFRSARSTFDVSLDYGLRSDGLDHVFGAVGWTWGF